MLCQMVDLGLVPDHVADADKGLHNQQPLARLVDRKKLGWTGHTRLPC